VHRLWERSQLDSEIRSLQKQVSSINPQDGIILDIKVAGNVVLSYNANSEIIQTREDNKLMAECTQVLDTAGADDYWLSYNPVNTGMSMQKMITPSSWSECRQWFRSVAVPETGGVTIVPDTNVIMNHYLSKVIFPIADELMFHDVQVVIPRTVILEIERQGNLEGKSFKKRKAIFAWSELLWLLDNGAQILSELDPNMLEGFSSIAGSRFGDALIRKEIRTYFGQPLMKNQPRVLFITCDLMNAFAACAERLDTLYLSRTASSEHRGDLGKLVDIILSAAILWEEIEVEFKQPTGITYKLSGMWEGKSITDWRNQLIEVMN
jgi:hypothetical protein